MRSDESLACTFKGSPDTFRKLFLSCWDGRCDRNPWIEWNMTGQMNAGRSPKMPDQEGNGAEEGSLKGR